MIRFPSSSLAPGRCFNFPAVVSAYDPAAIAIASAFLFDLAKRNDAAVVSATSTIMQIHPTRNDYSLVVTSKTSLLSAITHLRLKKANSE